jgi:hypothetical protein
LLSSVASALECAPPAKLKQKEGEGKTLHSWCEVEGKRQGSYEVFQVEQGLQSRAQYENGELHGHFQRFFSNGRVQADGEYARGKMNGHWTRHWPNGMLRDEGQWSEDLPSGTWKYYDEAGKLVREVAYAKNGEKHEVEKKTEAPPAPEPRDDHFRIRGGYLMAKRNQEQKLHFVGLGAEQKLFRWGRWLRTDFSARFFSERIPAKSNAVASAQAGVLFDWLPGFTRPIYFSTRFGAHFTEYKDDHFFFSLGLRYTPLRFKKGFAWSGVFLEINNVKYHDAHRNYGNNTQNNREDLDLFFAGLSFSFF